MSARTCTSPGRRDGIDTSFCCSAGHCQRRGAASIAFGVASHRGVRSTPPETMKRLRQVHDDHDDDGDDADHDYMNVIIHYQTCRGFPHQVMMRELRCSPPFPGKLCCLLCLLGIVPTRLPSPETESSWTHANTPRNGVFMSYSFRQPAAGRTPRGTGLEYTNGFLWHWNGSSVICHDDLRPSDQLWPCAAVILDLNPLKLP